MSRRHFQVEVTLDGKVTIQDLNSTNGTVVNSHRLVAPRQIFAGDIIEVGVLRFEFESIEEGIFDETTDVEFPSASDAVVEWVRRSETQQLPLENALKLHLKDKKKDGRDKRRHKRYEVNVPVRYASETLDFETNAVNVSISGIFIATAYLEPLGTECAVTIATQGAPETVINGRVVRVIENGHATIPPGLGIEFEFDGREAPVSWTSVLTRLRRPTLAS